jgi:hypothetical protein
MSSPNPPPLAESAWFWVYLFSTAALVALALAAPKYAERQPQLERRFLARQAGGQAVAGPEGPVAPASYSRMIIYQRPQFVICSVLLAAAWVRLWWQRRYGVGSG